MNTCVLYVVFVDTFKEAYHLNWIVGVTMSGQNMLAAFIFNHEHLFSLIYIGQFKVHVLCLSIH
jgi:hypothetical protein